MCIQDLFAQRCFLRKAVRQSSVMGCSDSNHQLSYSNISGSSMSLDSASYVDLRLF